MSDLKPKGKAVNLGGQTYGMLFTLNAIDDIQEHFNIDIYDMSNLFKDKVENDQIIVNRNKMRNLCWLLALLINENLDCEKDMGKPERAHVDARFVGRHITAGNWTSMANKILDAFREAAPVNDEDDTDPNSASE